MSSLSASSAPYSCPNARGSTPGAPPLVAAFAAVGALLLGTRSYSSVAAILKNHRENAATPMAEAPVLIHENIRGPGYYH